MQAVDRRELALFNLAIEFPVELLSPLRRALEDKKAELVCEPLPAEALSREYREEMGKVDSDSRKDATAKLDKHGRRHWLKRPDQL